MSCGKIFEESGLLFDFSASESAYVADKPNYPGLSAVDFVVEIPHEILFIEVKNPDSFRALEHGQRRDFIRKMSLDLFPIKMSAKFKDSILKELAAGRKFVKPIKYILLLECGEIDPKQRSTLLQRINGKVPKFSENGYSSVSKISVAVYNRKEFLNEYTDFKIIVLEETE